MTSKEKLEIAEKINKQIRDNFETQLQHYLNLGYEIVDRSETSVWFYFNHDMYWLFHYGMRKINPFPKHISYPNGIDLSEELKNRSRKDKIKNLLDADTNI